jgi:hypothetical protein
LSSRPDERRVASLQPVSATAALVETADPLRHDSLEAQLAGLGEDDRALGLDRLAEQDAVEAGDESRERLTPILERTQAQILALEPHKIEGHERRALPASPW